jgi:hypothetical protein
VASTNGAGPALRDDGGAARKIVGNGKRDGQSSGPVKNPRQIIRAELARSDHAAALGIIAQGAAPVLKLCRPLVEASHDPSQPLEAWRGGTLAIRIANYREERGSKTRTSCSSGNPKKVDFDAVNHAALPALPILLARWLPNGKRIGSLNPTTRRDFRSSVKTANRGSATPRRFVSQTSSR